MMRVLFSGALPMSWLITNLIAALLLPPLNLLLMATAGLLLWRKRPRLGRGLVWTAFALLWLLSTPWVSLGMLRMLEDTPSPLDTRTQTADAIVVLGAGTYLNAPEYGADTVGGGGLARLRYAAKLQRETGKPVLVTGGKPQGNTLSEAAQMKAVLEDEFHVPVKWTEGESTNTFENAQLSRKILEAQGIRRIYLVTHAWHMPRAAMAFRAAGFEVVPAATVYTLPGPLTLLDFVPAADALDGSSRALHEFIGMLWYRLKS
jgi:uncharacterized SAM-binding protein YcdF (DUF218 family)